MNDKVRKRKETARFTGGIWRVDDIEPGFTLNRLLIKSDAYRQEDICALNFHADPDECRANAELIADAPALMYHLHALCVEEALQYCKIPGYCKKCFIRKMREKHMTVEESEAWDTGNTKNTRNTEGEVKDE